MGIKFWELRKLFWLFIVVIRLVLLLKIKFICNFGLLVLVVVCSVVNNLGMYLGKGLGEVLLNKGFRLLLILLMG